MLDDESAVFKFLVLEASVLSDGDSDAYCMDKEEFPRPSKRLKVNSSKGKLGAALYRTKFRLVGTKNGHLQWQ